MANLPEDLGESYRLPEDSGCGTTALGKTERWDGQMTEEETTNFSEDGALRRGGSGATSTVEDQAWTSSHWENKGWRPPAL